MKTNMEQSVRFKTGGFNRDFKKKIVDYLLGTIILVPPITLVFIEFVLPFFSSFLSSFMVGGSFSLSNYQVVKDLYLGDILYTISISIIALIFVLLIAVTVGGILSLRTNKLIEFFFKIPLFVPFVVVGHAMRIFLAPKGILNIILAQVGVINLDNPPAYGSGTVGIITALVWKNMALALLLVMGAFRSVDKSYLEAARNFGASMFKQIKDILLPLSYSTLAISGILIFTSMLQCFSVPAMMGKGEGAQHIMIDVYHRITYLNDLGVANALGTISYILALGAAYYYLKKVLKKNG